MLQRVALGGRSTMTKKTNAWRATATAQRVAETIVPLRVQGTVRHPPDGGPWEYTVVLSIKNDRGDEIARHVVGVGAMQVNEERTFTLAVEAVPRNDGKGARRH